MTGCYLFVISATCSVLSCSAVSDCHSPFSIICTAFCSDACWCGEVGLVTRLHLLFGEVRSVTTALKVVEEVQEEVQEIESE